MRSLSWRLTLRVIAVLSWIVSLIWFIAQPGFEPLLAVLAGFATFLGSFAASDSPISEELKYTPTASQRARNRRAMLQLVKNTWVKGVLEQSLRGAVMLELGLEDRPEFVERPWNIVLQSIDQPNRTLRRGTKIINVFDEMNGALLILGEPGSGKTTMLLELARDLIVRAERDENQPIPVIFNLSSWTEKHQPIADWLAGELNSKYNIPKSIAAHWVADDELMLLLDGLDEVKSERRDECVQGINDFRKGHLVSLAVCSRIVDYQALVTRLRLQGAVVLQPLTSQQVDNYLTGAGVELLAVRRTLQHDSALRELAESPLMLSIMTLAYQDMSLEDLQPLASIAARRRHLFATYVQKMLKRRAVNRRYPPEQTVQWLTWLAQKMSHYGQTVFLIEGLQADWLWTPAQRRQHVILSRLLVGLLGGCIAGLLGVVLVGVLAGPSSATVYGSRDQMSGLLLFGLTLGLLGGLFGMLSGGLPTHSKKSVWKNIDPVEVLRWSWREAGIGLLGGMVILLLASLFGGLTRDQPDSIISWLFILLLLSLSFGLRSSEIGTKTVPNQGIRRSARNAVAIAGLVLLLFWLLGGLFGAALRNRSSSLIGGLIFGLLFGLLSGLSFGGRAFFQHVVLRFILYLNGHIPLNYARFLDYATDCIFLRKVGGGYIFIHRLLMEYFAEFESSGSDSAATAEIT